MRLWFDVEDLFEYARSVSRPSGIQRVCFELYRALRGLAGDRIGFVAHDLRAETMRVVDWSAIEATFARIASAPMGRRGATVPDAATPLMHGALIRVPALRRLAQQIPLEVRRPLGDALRGQVRVVANLGQAARALPRWLAERRAAPGPEVAIRGPDLREVARPGDVLASFGSPWSMPAYAAFVSKVRGETGLPFAMLVHDVIPVIRPEFCDRGLIDMFDAFIRGCLPQADCILTVSRSTAHDIEAWSARENINLRTRPQAVSLGTTFQAAATGTLPQGLHPGGYVLFVSTIEARKNHLVAFRAWRALLDQMPHDQVPTLVFAGRVGWMVGDLMQQIHNAGFLGGKLMLVEHPDDATLAALYAGARFTLFPSLYEGWGLPVSESLAFGKACLASSATSVPEAGGSFCLYHDPENLTETVALYRRALQEPDLVAGLERRIAAEYRATPWGDSAAAILRALEGGR